MVNKAIPTVPNHTYVGLVIASSKCTRSIINDMVGCHPSTSLNNNLPFFLRQNAYLLRCQLTKSDPYNC